MFEVEVALLTLQISWPLNFEAPRGVVKTDVAHPVPNSDLLQPSGLREFRTWTGTKSTRGSVSLKSFPSEEPSSS